MNRNRYAGSGRHSAPVAVTLVIAATIPTVAIAKSDVGVDVSLSAAASSNPFQSIAGTTGSASASLGVSPWLTFTESASKLTLAGDVRVTEYARVFSRSESFRLSASGNWQVTPQLDLAPSISFGEAIVGETNLVDFTAPGTVSPGVVVVNDPSLIGQRTRQQSLDTSLTAQYRPDGRQSWSASFYARQSRFSNLARGSDYVIYGETIGYNRAFRRGSFGATLNLQRYECRSGQACSQVIVSPQLTASVRLSGAWTLSGAAGISYSSLTLPTQQRKTVTPSISASLCRKDAKISVCLGASHTVEATAINGARPIFAANVSTNYRLTQKNTLVFAGSYAGTTSSGVGADSFRQFGARLTDEHRINQRIAVLVTGSHTISNSTLLGQRTNTEVSVGVRFSLGRRA